MTYDLLGNNHQTYNPYSQKTLSIQKNVNFKNAKIYPEQYTRQCCYGKKSSFVHDSSVKEQKKSLEDLQREQNANDAANQIVKESQKKIKELQRQIRQLHRTLTK